MSLSHNEAIMRDCVRKATYRYPEPIRYDGADIIAAGAALLRALAWEDHRVRYDSANRGLAGCVQKGLLVRPKRGWYALSRVEPEP